MYRILLACGVGASSGFISKAMRKAAKEKGIEVEVRAIGEAEILQYISDFEIVMLGSHYAFKIDEVRKKVQVATGVEKPVVLIDKSAYARLDGAAVLDAALKVLESEGKENE